MAEDRPFDIDIPEYGTLTISDDFMFCAVMRNKDLCRRVLECILGIEIDRIEFPHGQEVIDPANDMKSVRLDVYVKGSNNTVYDIEMQTTKYRNLPLRTRYYHSVADTDNLEKGMDYLDLPVSYVIFICTFDPSDEDRHYYSYSTRCDQNTEKVLDDRRKTIFLNTRGTKDDVSSDLRDFLNYFNVEMSDNKLVRDLDAEVRAKRLDKGLKEDYMTVMMRENEKYRQGREEGREEGKEEGIAVGEAKGKAESQRRMVQLIGILTDNNDFITLKNIAKDPTLLEELYKKYNI